MHVIDASSYLIDSIHKEELAKYFAIKSDLEDQDAKVLILVPMHCFFFFCRIWRLLIYYKLSTIISFKEQLNRNNKQIPISDVVCLF